MLLPAPAPIQKKYLIQHTFTATIRHIDDAKHAIFFLCDRWWRQKRDIEVETGQILEPNNTVQCMLSKKTNWNTVNGYVEMVLITRKN